MKAKVIAIGLAVLGVLVVVLAVIQRLRGNTQAAVKLEADHIERKATAKTKDLTTRIEALQAQGDTQAAQVEVLKKEAADVEAEVTQAFQSKGLSAAEISERFNRIRRIG